MLDNSSNISYSLLVDFDFIFDFDLAIFKYIKDNYSGSKYIDKRIIGFKNDAQVVYCLLHRKNINPLKMIMPKVDSTKLYNDLMNNHEEELLSYETLYDSIFLFVTYFNRIPSIEITVLCKNELESNYVKDKNNKFNTIIQPDKSKVDLSPYTIIYSKYYSDILAYGEIHGKYIYVSLARYNYDKNGAIKGQLIFYTDLNIIKLMDLYTTVVYESEFQKQERENIDDILEHSTGISSAEDSKGDSWYNLRFPK